MYNREDAGMTDDEQWKQDFCLMVHYRQALEKIANGLSQSPQALAVETLDNYMPPEFRLWNRIAELEVCISQMCNNARNLGYCTMPAWPDCDLCKTTRVLKGGRL